jgi:hypothetical protein
MKTVLIYVNTSAEVGGRRPWCSLAASGLLYVNYTAIGCCN